MRRCYEELDRRALDPTCPIRSWDDAVAPSNLAGVVDAARRARGSRGWRRFSPTTGAARRSVTAPRGPVALGRWPTSSSARSNCCSTSCRRCRLPRRAAGGSVASQHLADAARGAPRRESRPRPCLRGRRVPRSSAWPCRSAGPSGSANWPGGRHRSDLQLERPSPPSSSRSGTALRRPSCSTGRRGARYELIELVTANLVGIVVDGLLHESRRLRGHRPPRLPRVAAGARDRPRVAGVADPPGHVRPRLRLRGRRSRPARASAPGSACSSQPRC